MSVPVTSFLFSLRNFQYGDKSPLGPGSGVECRGRGGKRKIGQPK